MIPQYLLPCQISLPQGKNILFTLRRQTPQVLTDYSLSSSRDLLCAPSVASRLCQPAHAATSTSPIIHLLCHHHSSDPPSDPKPSTMGAERTQNYNGSLPLLLPQPSLQTVKNSGFFYGSAYCGTERPLNYPASQLALTKLSLGCRRP